MKQELVEKVMRALEAAWTDSDDPDHGWAFMARYALALAERAAREAECGHVGMAAVQRAVEGA